MVSSKLCHSQASVLLPLVPGNAHSYPSTRLSDCSGRCCWLCSLRIALRWRSAYIRFSRDWFGDNHWQKWRGRRRIGIARMWVAVQSQVRSQLSVPRETLELFQELGKGAGAFFLLCWPVLQGTAPGRRDDVKGGFFFPPVEIVPKGIESSGLYANRIWNCWGDFSPEWDVGGDA